MNISFVRLAVFQFGILLEFTWGEKGSPVAQKANTENTVVRIQAEKFGFFVCSDHFTRIQTCNVYQACSNLCSHSKYVTLCQ